MLDILLLQIKFDPTISISGIVSVIMLIVAIIGALTLMNYRVKDLNELKPVIQKIPLMEQGITNLTNSMARIEGTLAAVPGITATVSHLETENAEIKRRLERLEAKAT